MRFGAPTGSFIGDLAAFTQSGVYLLWGDPDCSVLNEAYEDIFPDPEEQVISQQLCSSYTATDLDELFDAWDTGLNWWLTANDRYKVAIGAYTTEVVLGSNIACYCEVYEPNGDYTDNYLYSFYSTPNGSMGGACGSSFVPGFYTICEQVSTNTYAVNTIKKESDGVVLAESAAGLPGADAVVKMPGSSHMQMRNDENLMLGLNALWNGEYEEFFETEEK